MIYYIIFVLSGAAPFESLMVADVGDMTINQFNLTQAVSQIKDQTSTLIKDGCKPLIMGGDHTISYPILQAIKVSLSSVYFPAVCLRSSATISGNGHHGSWKSPEVQWGNMPTLNAVFV